MLASRAWLFVDLRQAPTHASLDPDPAVGYPAGNAVAAAARAAGHNGIIYPSVRHAGGTCIAALWPNVVQSVVPGAMSRLTWSGTPAYSVEALDQPSATFTFTRHILWLRRDLGSQLSFWRACRKFGRSSCREGEGQYVLVSLVVVALKKQH